MISSGSCWRGCVRNAPNDFPRIPSIVVQAPSFVDAVDVVAVGRRGCGCRRRDVDWTLNSAHVSQLLEPIFALVRIRIFAYKAENSLRFAPQQTQSASQRNSDLVQQRGYLRISNRVW